MDYISIFATSSYVDPVGLCCGGKIFFSHQKSPRCLLGGGGASPLTMCRNNGAVSYLFLCL
jgi:hypothetical protein